MKIVIISGPTGSGKTTLAKNLKVKLESAILLSTDNYYKTGFLSKFLTKFVKDYFDRNISFNYKNFKKDLNSIIKNRKLNHTYNYDFKNKTTKKSEEMQKNINTLIIEGIFAREIFSFFLNYKLFLIELETNKDLCMNRAIYRDVNERGKTKKKAKSDFLRSWKFYYKKYKKIKEIHKAQELIYTKKTDLDEIINNLNF